MEQARERFEQRLKNERDMNQKNLEDYQTYMDETGKF